MRWNRCGKTEERILHRSGFGAVAGLYGDRADGARGARRARLIFVIYGREVTEYPAELSCGGDFVCAGGGGFGSGGEERLIG